ncbi:MAG: multiprotein bridging factor aMBF1 [Candidatus Bathyarchaeia archaeon]
MRCEVCGRKIHGKPYNVIIEGAKLTVCSECSKHGKLILEEEKPKAPMQKIMPTTPKTATTLKMQQKRPQETKLASFELIEDFNVKIKQAREKLGLSHKDLGKKLNEKVSVLRKIETGKMTPDDILAKKLEHELKIKLLVPVAEETVSQAKIPKLEKRELTLGDIIQLGKKEKDAEKGETSERKQS